MDAAQTEKFTELLEKLGQWDTENLDCGSAAELRELVQDVHLQAYNSGYTAGRDGEARQHEAAEQRHNDELYDAWNQGFQSGGAVIQRAWRESATQALLEALGKDRGDGPINLGAAGTVFANNS